VIVEFHRHVFPPWVRDPMVGAQRVLFGSDFPLLSQGRCLIEMREVALQDQARRLILGENAWRLLRLAHGAT